LQRHKNENVLPSKMESKAHKSDIEGTTTPPFLMA